MEDLTKKPLVEIVQEITYLEQEIGMKQIKDEKELNLMILKYEKLRLEMIRRFPVLENMNDFKKKEFKK